LENTHRQKQGRLGEKLAADYLREKGYHIRSRNWRYHPFEIDIIAEKNQELVFVEVKLRENNDLLELWELVSKSQQKRIMAAAHEYVLMNDLDLESRFDIIGIHIIKGEASIEHYEDAFYP